MKRTISMILLAALLLLVALPAFAEGEAALQPGLYVSDSGNDVLYLDEKGGGVFDYVSSENQLFANGLTWADGVLEIERIRTPYTLQGDMLVFTYDNVVWILHYAGAGEDYALGDRAGTAFAGTYLAADGKKLTLAADGQGVYTDAAGDTAVLWGSLIPYWAALDNVSEETCFILFDSFLGGMEFEEEAVTVSTEDGAQIVFQRQAAQPAGEGGLYYGYRMTANGQTMDLVPLLKAMGMDPKDIYLELRADGTGHIQIMDTDSAGDFNWTDGYLTYEGESVPFTWEGDHILLTVEGESIEFAPAAEVEALLNGSGTGVVDEPADDPLVGVWTLTKAKAMGIEIPASMMGTTMSLELKADGKAILTTGEEPIDLEWALKEDGTIALSAVGSEIFTLTYDGAALSLLTEGDSVEMIFEKEN